MYYVYLIQSLKDGTLYVGYTSDLKRRFDEHQKGFGKYTKDKRPWKLLYYEAYQEKTVALKRENTLKKRKNIYHQLLKRLNVRK